MLKFKVVSLRILLSIVLLFLFIGHLGLGLFSAHWFSLLRNEFWDDFNLPSYKYCAISVSVILSVILILLVFDISYEFHKLFAAISGILMLVVISIVAYILSCLTDEKDKDLREKAPKILAKSERFPIVNKCSWDDNKSLANCSTIAEKFIDIRLNRTYNWFLFYLLSWVISFFLTVPVIYLITKVSSE